MANEKNVELKLKDVRLSFFSVFQPQERRNDAGELTGMNYNCNLLLKKTDPQVEIVKKAMADVKKAMWGENGPRLAGDKLCLKNGEPVDEATGQAKALYEGYEGCFFVSANKPVKMDKYALIKSGQLKRPVKVIGPRKGLDGLFRELNEGDQYAPYSGCYVNAIINVYAYAGDKEKNQPPRINASLEAIQFKRDGEPFGNRGVDVNSAFDEEDAPTDDMGGSGAAPKDEFDLG